MEYAQHGRWVCVHDALLSVATFASFASHSLSSSKLGSIT